MECERSFYEVVAAKDIYLSELCRKKVIPQTVADKITRSHSVKEARGHLFDHIRDYGTIDTLKVFCDVITSEEYDGFQAMQDFGLEMKRRLEQEGRNMYADQFVYLMTFFMLLHHVLSIQFWEIYTLIIRCALPW